MYRSTRIAAGSALVATPALVILRARELEERYPTAQISTQNKAFYAPIQSHLYIPLDLVTSCSAKVPLSSFKTPTNLNEEFSVAFCSTKLAQLETRLLSKSSSPAEPTFNKGDRLLGGAWEVIQPPSQTEPLIVRWFMATAVVNWFSKISVYGYPWRMMSGGTQLLGAINVGRAAGEDEEMVELVFGSAHDYEKTDASGKEDGKRIPWLTEKMHQWYSRELLDAAVKDLRSSDIK